MYVTIEGLDGSGKTTVAQSLEKRFAGTLLTQEPCGELWTGEAVRTALGSDTGPVTDLFLFMADRAEHLHSVVEPALEEGRLVVSDRSADSTYAYQSHRINESGAEPEGGPWAWFDQMYEPWDVEPDLTLYLDISVDTALERCDREEKYENREFLKHVKRNYTTLRGKHADRYVVIDGEQGPEEVARDAADAVGARTDAGGAKPLVADGGDPGDGP